MLTRVTIFGLQLLLFLHTSEAFVLLTANIEDIKKLATKFVSETLADKIAAFIAKAAEHVMTHKSEELINKDVSEENTHYNVKQVSSAEFEFEKKKPKKQYASEEFEYETNKKRMKKRLPSEEFDENKKVKKNRHKKYRNDYSDDDMRERANKGNHRYVLARAKSIENNKVEDPNLNKSFSAVIDLNLRSGSEFVSEKPVIHHKHPQYKLLATSGNMVLTQVVTGK